MAHRKTPSETSEWKENCQKVEMPSCSTIDAAKQKESPSDDADTSACAEDDHNIQDTPLSPKTHPNPTGKNNLYSMNSQSNLHPREYKALNPQFLNPMYEPGVFSAAELQADRCDGVLRSQGDGGSNNNVRLAAAESGQTLEVTVGDDHMEPGSPDEFQADNCGGIQGDGGSDNNEHAAATESGKTVEVTVGNDNTEPDSPDELQSDNCDEIIPYEVFYEETDCSNNGTSATKAESGKITDEAVVVDDIEPCQDDTPSTENTQRNAPTSHENGNNVGQQKTTCGCKCRRMWIKPAAVTAANLVLSTIIFLVIFYTSYQGCTCPQANNSAVAHPTPFAPWKSTVPQRNVTANEFLTVDTEGQTEKPDNKDGQQTHTDQVPPAVSTRQNYFSDCSEIHTAKNGYGGVSDGVYKILPVDLSSPISVYCDQTTDGGGWTVMQRRFDGSIDFNRPYNDFRYGFGSANGEQWLGLENMYRLTEQNAYELYIELEDWNSVVKYAKYSSFSVGRRSSNYRLSVGGYTGTAGDGFSLSSSSSIYYLSGRYFSARDVDLDTNIRSCAGGFSAFTGGWWYSSCGYSALNGPYLRPSDRTSYSGYGIFWEQFGGSYRYYLKKSKMMVRPANFKTEWTASSSLHFRRPKKQFSTRFAMPSNMAG
ncbi:hypothetical protein Bbelb_314110 [Branchiostoma belcheri]|nr:hypothetical protein Bbelb_314110 [Branchiostoma belcheri]